MDYTKDTLSMGDVRMCDEKCTAQEPGYEGGPADHTRNEDCKGSQHEMSLLGASLPAHTTSQAGNKELNTVGTDSLVHGGFGVESNIMAENVYQTRAESASQFMRSYIYDEENKISRNADEVMKQRTNDRVASFYYNEDITAPENMDSENGDCLDRSHHNTTVNELRSLSTLGLEKEGKGISGGENYESVVSDFLPATPQGKDQQCLDIPVDRRLQYDETPQSKTFQFEGTPHENSSGYSQITPHDSHFAGLNFPRSEHLIDTKQAQSLLYEESSVKTTESFFSNINKVDFGNSSKDIHRSSVPPVDSDLSRRLGSGDASALASLQDTEVVAEIETEHSRDQEVEKNEALESHADLAEGGSNDKNREKNDKAYLSKSSNLMEPHLQIRSEGMTRANPGHQLKGEQEFSSFIEDNAKAKVAEVSDKSLTDDDLTLPGETDKDENKGKSSFDTIKCAISDSETEVEDMEEYVNKAEKTDDKDAIVFPVGSSATKRKNPPVEEEEDAASVQSIESPPSPPIGTRRRFKCKICNRTWKFRKGLNKHMKTHTEANKFKCSNCNSSFINRNLLKKHLLVHSDAKLFPCQDCSTTCSSIEELKRHQRVHTNGRAFPCPQCSYKAKHKKGLTKHMVVHSATKVYKCEICKFSSKRNYSLQRHMKTAHSSTLIHECSACNFKTSTNDSFKSHVVMHLSKRTTACIICGALIKKKANLTEHLLNHYNDKNSTCKHCDETFTAGDEYMLHLLGHKELTSSGHDEVNQSSGFDLGAPSLPNGSVDSASGTFGFLARKSKIIMTTPMMEAKLSQMSSVSSRLADMTKVVSLLNEKAKVIYQLAEISTLATELAVISGNVLQSYKNTYGVTVGASSSVNKAPSVSNDISEDSSFMDDDYEMSSMLNLPAAKIKEELFDSMFASTEAGMQIQVDFNGEPVSCVQKEDTFSQENLSKSRGDKHLKCNRCQLTFTDNRSLKRHIMAHDDVRPYSCDKCGQSFRRNEHLKKHMVTHSDERPFVCKDCPYAAKTEHRLKIHMLCHSQTKAYACQHCTYTARTNYELNHHMKRHEPRSCSQCNFICYSRTEMKKHVFTHSSFDCNECEFTTSDRAEYNKHMKRHSIIQHLCCELCGYSCDTMKKFKYHKLRHENKTPYQCSDCDYKCSSRASYDCHRLKHAGLKPYLCSFCGAAFRKTSHLNQHLLIHKDEKSFRCGECGYSCRTKHNLKEHEMTHSGEKPFICKYCSFSCRRNKALQLHMLKHEGQSMMIPQLQMPQLQMPTLQYPPLLHMSMIPSRP